MSTVSLCQTPMVLVPVVSQEPMRLAYSFYGCNLAEASPFFDPIVVAGNDLIEEC